ncbi:hypothetical protein BJX65DRAFT_248118 [Aspergillus insuetus]
MWLRVELRCLVLRALCRHWSLPPPTATVVLRQTSGGRSTMTRSPRYTLATKTATLLSQVLFADGFSADRKRRPGWVLERISLSAVTGRQGRPGQLLLTASLSHTP